MAGNRKECGISQMLHTALRTNDRLVGRYLSDSSPNDPKAKLLYSEWCEIDDLAPKRETGDAGYGEGFSVCRVER